MNGLTLVVPLLAALLGFVVGCCYEGCRRGGTLDLHRRLFEARRHVDVLEQDLQSQRQLTGPPRLRLVGHVPVPRQVRRG